MGSPKNNTVCKEKNAFPIQNKKREEKKNWLRTKLGQRKPNKQTKTLVGFKLKVAYIVDLFSTML